MSTPVEIIDGRGGTGDHAKVSSIGQLITAPFAYSLSQFNELAEDNTAYNFYPPIAGKQFVITGIRARADRDVSTTVDAIVIVYEASSLTSTTVDKTLHQEALVRGEAVPLLPLNSLVNPGKFINAKTTDDDIHMTIWGYYIPVL